MARPEGKQDTRPTSMRIPTKIDRLWTATAEKLSLPKTSVMILAISELAAKHGVTVEEEVSNGND